MAANVPAVYERIEEGYSDREFLGLRFSLDPQERSMGDTYNHLFRVSPSSASFAAAYDGKDLVVVKGNHRIRAAQQVGVPVVPVWVRASSTEELNRVEAALDRRMEREGTGQYAHAHLCHELGRGHAENLARVQHRSEPERSGPRRGR